MAFYLAAGLRAELVRRGIWAKDKPPNLKKYLDLVAIGTVADMVPLQDANRVLVKVGLEVINRFPGAGIKAILEQIGPGSMKVMAETIAFQLAPRLNAAGRTGSAEQALQLLLAEEEKYAKELAQSLGQANQLRKKLSEFMYKEALIQAQNQLAEGQLVLVVASEGWHQGIAGLVAAKLARDFWRPSVVLTLDQTGLARGSARSVGNFDILACLKECSAILDKYGGHRAAAGVSLQSDRIAEFQTKIAKSVAASINLADLKPRLIIDLSADPGEIMEEAIWRFLQQMEPYGNGNPEPIFCCRSEGVKLSEVRKVGADSLRFKIMVKDKGFAGIGFGMSAWATTAEREPLRLAYKIILNNFRGSEQWEIRVEDIKKPT